MKNKRLIIASLLIEFSLFALFITAIVISEKNKDLLFSLAAVIFIVFFANLYTIPILVTIFKSDRKTHGKILIVLYSLFIILGMIAALKNNSLALFFCCLALVFIPIFTIINYSISSMIYERKNRNSKLKRNIIYQNHTPFTNQNPLNNNLITQRNNANIYQYNNQNQAQYNSYNQLSANNPTYQKSNLLTNYETQLYNILDKYSREHNYRVISKIRLADLIESSNNNYTDFNKISRKHIDFAICEPNRLQPLILIELDDNTHDREDRRLRDDFVNKSLVESGYKILHIRSINENYIYTNLNTIINTCNTAGVFYI